jgi:AcrR family transcriptional regulator/predicted DNA-binding transcriptional regulator AlpA
MEETYRYMRISELSKLSGVPIPRIRYYVQKGILPRPIKAKTTSAYYSDEHVERLKIIGKMHQRKSPSVALIKEMIDSVSEIEGNGQTSHPDPSQIIRDKIIVSSIPIFRRKGYERTTITDIVESAAISRNTFYENFKNKEELFVECLQKIFFDWRKQAPPEGAVPITTLIKRMFSSFYKAYPDWSDMMNLFRASATKYPDIFADRLEQSLNIRIKPIVNDVKKGINQGVFREIDSELAGVMIAGIVDYVSYFIMRGKFKEPCSTIEASVDMLVSGLKSDSYIPESRPDSSQQDSAQFDGNIECDD